MFNQFGYLFLVVFCFGLFISGAWFPVLMLVIGIKLFNVWLNSWLKSREEHKDKTKKKRTTRSDIDETEIDISQYGYGKRSQRKHKLKKGRPLRPTKKKVV